MLSRFFPRGGRRKPGYGQVPQGIRIYAIGDVHGRLDLLDELLLKIDADDRSRPTIETHLIFLGDLIDRGPHSAQVIQRALELHRNRQNTRFLLGNHEEVFLKAIRGDLKALAFFIRIGGKETILSYGISETTYREKDYPELLDMLLTYIPPQHLRFLEEFEDLMVYGDYAFVHAGIRPGEPLDQQKGSDLRWIRHAFLDHRSPLEKIIVHGHTISDEVEILDHRIGLDTGAYASGRLSAMGFENGQRWILQAQGSHTA